MPTVTRRRNGIVRVPKLWVDAAAEAFFDLQAKGGGSITIPLPLKSFPYPKIRTALLAIYPQKFVPLFFKVGVISAPGAGSRFWFELPTALPRQTRSPFLSP